MWRHGMWVKPERREAPMMTAATSSALAALTWWMTRINGTHSATELPSVFGGYCCFLGLLLDIVVRLII
jgi:hypothetical protein